MQYRAYRRNHSVCILKHWRKIKGVEREMSEELEACLTWTHTMTMDGAVLLCLLRIDSALKTSST